MPVGCATTFATVAYRATIATTPNPSVPSLDPPRLAASVTAIAAEAIIARTPVA